MTIKLKEAVFVNDFFNLELPNGATLTLNSIDESIKSSSNTTAIVKAINIQVVYATEDATYYSDCTNVIGLKDDLIEIKTEYKEYEGLVLNTENMKFCTLEVFTDAEG